MRKPAIPNGIVTTRMQQMMPATTYPSASQGPATTGQMMLSSVFTGTVLSRPFSPTGAPVPIGDHPETTRVLRAPSDLDGPHAPPRAAVRAARAGRAQPRPGAG